MPENDLTQEKEKRVSQSAANVHNSTTGGISLSPPPIDHTIGATIQMHPNDTVTGLFRGDERIMTDSNVGEVNNPRFDPAVMRDQMMRAEFEGAGSLELNKAMEALQGVRGERGLEFPSLEEAAPHLNTIASIRGLNIEDTIAQYQRMQTIRRAGEERGRQHGHEDVSPLLDLQEHGDFMGSTNQLKFGMALGDVFDVDPVFGALISPTGGAVGPGNDSISTWDKNNPVALHGSVHDAAGYLLNAHGIGPGYNYLGRNWELDRTNPLSGQVSGIDYFSGGLTGLTGYGLNAAGEGILGLAGDAWNWAGNTWDSAKSGLRSGAQWVGNKASNAWDSISGLAGDAWNWAGDTWDSAKSGLRSGAQWVGNKASNAWDSISGLAGDAWNWAGDTWDSAQSGLRSGAEWVGNKASNAWDSISGLAGDAWNWAGDTWDSAQSGLRSGAEFVRNAWNSNQATVTNYEYGSRQSGYGFSAPHAYAGYTRDADGNTLNGLEAGFQGFGVDSGVSSANWLYGNIQGGEMYDPNGGSRYGVSGSAGVGRGSLNLIEVANLFGADIDSDHYNASIDLGAGTASANAWGNAETGFSLGAGASAAEIALNLGTSGTGDLDRQARVGWGLGPAAGLRGHWADSDGDGLREYGFGFDLPIGFTMDYKTEDPLGDVLRNGVLPGAAPLMNSILGDSNVTVATSEAVSDAWDWTSNAASNAWDSTTSAASGAWDKLTSIFL